jgi:hypothetical protein
MARWFETSRRGYLLDFQMPDSADQVPLGQLPTLRDLDPRRIVAQLKDAGATALYVHARDYAGNCYYDTKVGHKHSALGDHDMLREFSAACRRARMNILYYVYMAQAHEPRGECHAERDFAAVDADGRRATDKLMCMNSPGRDYIEALLRELSAGYDFDGYWLDCFGWGAWGKPCYCEACKARFLADTGCALPAPDDQALSSRRTYRRWIQRQRLVVKREINGVIRSANPKLTIVYNEGPKGIRRGTAGPGHFDGDDYLCTEFHYEDGHGSLPLDCRAHQAVKPGVPFEIEVYRFHVRFNKMERANQVRSVDHLFSEMATVIANGGMIQYYDQILPDGTLCPRSLERLKGAFAEVRRREPFAPRGQRRVPYAAILWSGASDAFAADPAAREHGKDLDGFHFALMEKHIPYGLVTDKSLRAGELGGARVVILPNVTCLSEEEAATLRQFVRGGGGLVATHRTSMQDEWGNPRPDFLLADLFGADYLEQLSYRYSFVKLSGKHALFEGLPPGWPMSVFKEWQLKVAVRDSARGHGCIVHPFRGHRLVHMPGEEAPYPGLVTHEVGKGRVVYVPHPLGLCYGEYGHPDHRQLIANAVRWAAGEAPPIEVEAPATVEVEPWESASSDKWMIHLLNFTAAGPARTKGSVIDEAIPVHDLVLRLPFRVRRATLQPEARELKVRPVGGGSEIVVPRLETYSVVVVER